jgi:hypothetical protein
MLRILQRFQLPREAPLGLTGCASAFFKSGEFPTNSIELRPPVRINTPDDQATQTPNSGEPLWLRNQITITFKDEPLMLGSAAKHLSLTRPSPNMSMSRFLPLIYYGPTIHSRHQGCN